MISNYQIFKMFLFLGLTSFGGPTAHIGYLHNRFVEKIKWISNKDFLELVALCQFFPGPTSSQIVYSIGLIKKGFLGGLLAWFGFTLPSACIMIFFAYGVEFITDDSNLGLMRGLISVSVPIVGIALWYMSRSLCIDFYHWLICFGATIILMFLDSGFGHLAVIVFGMSSGLLLHSIEVRSDHSTILFPLGNKWALFLLFTFIFFLISPPVFSKLSGLENWNIFANFYRSGALVFGGGHVVLPLLQADFVPTGFLSEEQFLVGYGVAQAIPGPMFTFASYLGTLLAFESGSLWYAPTLGVVCLLWIYLPTFLLVPPALWFWSALRGRKKIRAGLSGINAAVVGLLIHSFLFTVIPASLVSALDIVLVCVGFLMLVAFKLPAWIVVLALGSLGWGLAAII